MMAWIGILLGSAAVVLIAGLIAGSRARRLRSVPPATATAPALPEPTHFPLWTGDQDAMADGCGLPWSSRWAPVGVCRPAVAGAPRITHRPPGDVSGGCTAGHSRCPGCPRTAVSVPAGSPQTRTRRAAGTVPVEVTTAAATAGTSPSPVPARTTTPDATKQFAPGHCGPAVSGWFLAVGLGGLLVAGPGMPRLRRPQEALGGPDAVSRTAERPPWRARVRGNRDLRCSRVSSPPCARPRAGKAPSPSPEGGHRRQPMPGCRLRGRI